MLQFTWPSDGEGVTVELMRLMRRNVLAIISASLLSLSGPSAQATAGPIIKCRRVGQKTVFRGYRYSCIQSKGTLVWKRGAKVATPTPSATESTSELVFVALSDEIIEGQIKIVEVKPTLKQSLLVSVVRFGGAVVVLSTVCTHKGCIVDVDRGQLACPCHGAIFNATNGIAIRTPHKGVPLKALRKYTSSEDAGSIYIKI